MMHNYRHLQHGFSLIAAIFILLTVAIIVTAVVVTISARSKSTALNIEATRAYYSAASGLEIAIARVLSAGCAGIPATVSINNYSVALTCNSFAISEGGASYNVYSLTAQVKSGDLAQSTLVSRQLRATVSER